MVKMQEPNVVAPVAVAPSALMANAGVSPMLVKATVVGVVVPKSGTPAAKVKGSFTTAAAVVAVTATGGRLLDAIDALTGAEVPPPPHAAKAAETSTVKNNLLVLVISGLYWKVSY